MDDKFEKYFQYRESKEKEATENAFLQWLVGTRNQKVEEQLFMLIARRQPGTLRDAHKIDEFQIWITTGPEAALRKRMLWISGPPGFGKSMLAAYFVEFLSRYHADASLAYFFCKKGIEGLTKASDIVRTLAYQCSLVDPKVRSKLEALMKGGFDIDLAKGTEFLFQKLLKEPLRNTSKPVYLIIDGLNEVDTKFDRANPRNQEMELFVDCLCALPSARILLLSVPHPCVSRLADEATKRHFGSDDNKSDIEQYLKGTLNEELLTIFRAEQVDPNVLLSPAHHRGNFFWIVLVIEQLSRASPSAARYFLRNALRASGDLIQIYNKIFNEVEHEDRRWIKQILQWVTVASRPLTTEELQAAVQCSFKEPMTASQFVSFLDMKCGAFLDSRARFGQGRVVELFHETFRSYLLDEQSECPKAWHVDSQLAHGLAALNCLQFLVKFGAESKPFVRYATMNWFYHLENAKSGEHDADILVSLRDFFSSEALGLWTREMLGLRQWQPGEVETLLEINVEEMPLSNVRKWLEKSQRSVHLGMSRLPLREPWNNVILFKVRTWLYSTLKTGTGRSTGLEQPEPNISLRWFLQSVRNWLELFLPGQADVESEQDLQNAVNWRRDILSDHVELLGEYVGKISTRMWLSEDFDEVSTIAGVFSLALKYYCRRERRAKDRAEDIRNLLNNGFTSIVAWAAEGTRRDEIKKRNLGVAYSLLRQHDASIKCYRDLLRKSYRDEKLWGEIGSVFLGKCDHSHAIQLFRSALEINDASPSWWRLLAAAYRWSGERKKAIDAAKAAVNRNPYDSESWRELGDAFRADGKYEAAVAAYKNSLDTDPGNRHTCAALAACCRILGERDEWMRACGTLAESNPSADASSVCGWAYKAASEAYEEAGEYDKCNEYQLEALRLFKKATDDDPSCIGAWKGLADIHNAKAEYEKTIKEYHRAWQSNRDSSWVHSGIGEVYRAKDDILSSIEKYETATLLNPTDSWALTCLGDAYKTHGDYESAIKIFEESIAVNPLDSWSRKGLAESYRAQELYEDAIDVYRSAIKKIPVDYSLQISLGLLYHDIGWFGFSRECFLEALERCPAGEQMLLAFLHLPTCPLLSDHPKLIMDQNIISSFFWFYLAGTFLNTGAHDKAIEIYDSVIDAYQSATKASRNNFLWCYSAYFAGKGLDIFEHRRMLPVEYIWVGLGSAYNAKQLYDKAAEAYSQAISRLPENRWLQTRLEEIRAKQHEKRISSSAKQEPDGL